jgi:hypothetical protein
MFNVSNTILEWIFKKFHSVFYIEINVRLFFINFIHDNDGEFSKKMTASLSRKKWRMHLDLLT